MGTIKLTTTAEDVLAVIVHAPPDRPVWGLRIAELTGLPHALVYPCLVRLAEAGWVTGYWEEPPPWGRPPRCLYVATDAGREAWEAVQERRAKLIAVAQEEG